MKRGGKILRNRIFCSSSAACSITISCRRDSSASECHLLSFAEVEDLDQKKEKRVLRNRSLPSISTLPSSENMGRPSRTKAGPSENNRSCSGRAMDDDGRLTTMAAGEMCTKQLQNLRPQQRDHAIRQLNNTPNLSCDLCAPIQEFGGTNNNTLKEIITENLWEKPRIGVQNVFKGKKCKK